MNLPENEIAAALAAACGKILPGVAGSLFGLRFIPCETWFERACVFASGVSASVYLAPLLLEFTGASTVAALTGVGFAVGAFGLVVVAELVKAWREVGLADILRAWLKKLLGVA